MTSIRKRPDGRWRARYRDETGKEHARHFRRKIDAQQWIDEVTASIVTGQYVDPKAGREKLRATAKRWQANQVGSDATARIVDNAVRLHILPTLGDRPVGSIRRSDVQALVKSLSATLAPGTVRNVYDVLARIFAAAVDDRMITQSPCRRIALPATGDQEVDPPTVDQVMALAGEVPPRYRAAVVMLAGSGLRIGELLGLRVSDVDFLRRTARVERQRYQDERIGPPKTPQSTRTVPLGQVVVDELAAHLAAYPSGEWLFTTSRGKPLSYRAWKTVWKNARTRIGLDLDTHALRHFFASALIAEGASVKQVQTVLGHSSAVITLRVYAHLWPGDDDRTRSAIDSVLRTGCGLGDESPRSDAGQSG